MASMRYDIKIILTSLLAVLMTLPAMAYTPSDTVKVRFPSGQSRFNPGVRDNREAMDGFIDAVRKAKANDEIDRISVRGYASPEGSSEENEQIATLRSEAIADYISAIAGIDRNLIQTIPCGVDWGELRNLVATNPDVPYRDKILGILDNTPVWVFDRQGNITGGRKDQLMKLAGGRPFHWLETNIFPDLRYAVGELLLLKDVKPQPTTKSDISEIHAIVSETLPADTLQIDSVFLPADTVVNVPDTIIENKPRSFFMAVKTNMLYDAAFVPNLAAEFYLGKNISIYGEWMYAWWDSNPRHRYWRIYGGDLGVRWWFGRKAHEKPLTGHHAGLYGGVMMFDFEMGDTGYMGGKPGGTLWDRCLVFGGLEYGYSLPVAKRLNIDFSIGVGYIGGNYIKYFPFDNDYYKEKEYRMHYFGPTKAEISLVWLIGRGNTNKKKGGGR